MTNHWNPVPNADAKDGRVALGEAVRQALGTASVCWENPGGAGVFDDGAYREVYDGLMAYLSDWADEQRRQANEATAGKLRAEIEAVLAADEVDSDVTSGEAIWEQGGYRRGLAVAADIARGEL